MSGTVGYLHKKKLSLDRIYQHFLRNLGKIEVKIIFRKKFLSKIAKTTKMAILEHKIIVQIEKELYFPQKQGFYKKKVILEEISFVEIIFPTILFPALQNKKPYKPKHQRKFPSSGAPISNITELIQVFHKLLFLLEKLQHRHNLFHEV